MYQSTIHKIISGLLATVWLVNGLFCKLLNEVPRHQQIVARILGPEHAYFFTKAIGIAEVLMAAWMASSFQPRWCAVVQIVVIVTMNTTEFILAPDLLLFGKMNALVALFLVAVIYLNAFVLDRNKVGK